MNRAAPFIIWFVLPLVAAFLVVLCSSAVR